VRDDPSTLETFGARLHRLPAGPGIHACRVRPSVRGSAGRRFGRGKLTGARRAGSKTKILLEVLGVTEDELFGTVGADERVRHGTAWPAAATPLQRAISEAKERVADLAGTSPDKVRVIIEI
jgi:hypothetical protein